MPVIVYKTMTIELTYAYGRRINCEHCGKPFTYIHYDNRSEQVTGVPLLSSDDKMRDNAAKQAIKNLAKLADKQKLGQATCPHCRQYQPWMISSAKATGFGCGALAGLSKSRYFNFPVRQYSFEWWQRTIDSIEIQMLVENSLLIAFFVTLISVVVAFFGALAFARYDWKGRKLYQKLILLPIFFPQPVLGLALLLWFNVLGITTSWHTAAAAHLVAYLERLAPGDRQMLQLGADLLKAAFS